MQTGELQRKPQKCIDFPERTVIYLTCSAGLDGPPVLRICAAGLKNFLFQIPEQVRIKENRKLDFQSIADPLDGGNGCWIIPFIDDVEQGGVGDSAFFGQGSWRQVMLVAELEDPPSDGVFESHK